MTSLVVVLHAHLPWVRAVEPWTTEERWLHEALWECYLPLLELIARLGRDGVAAPLTLSLSPTLLAMWSDETLRERFDAHLDAVRRLNEREVQAPALRHHYRERLDAAASRWSTSLDLPGAFGDQHRAGQVELTTTAATHGLLPALAPHAIARQLGLGREAFARATGVEPAGLWLPECAFDDAVDRALAQADISHVVVAEHAVAFARPRPARRTRPVVTPRGIVAAPRDREATLRVWSPKTGYPATGAYREFHRDLGHLAEHPPFGQGTMTGLKLHRIDGAPYDPAAAEARAVTDADDMLRWLVDRKDHALLAFDAELFGHWWHEGLSFLEHLLRGASARGIAVTPLSRWLQSGSWPVAEPAASTWGRGGDGHTWLGPRTARHWRLARSTDALARQAGSLDAARAQLLLEASDWPFLVDAGPARGYALEQVAQLTRVVEGEPSPTPLPFDDDLVRRWFTPRARRG